MVGKDQAKLIDACDLVIRFNEWKNYGENCGQRVDVLCICNTGNPARDFIRRACIRKAPFYDLVSEIWFPRDSSVHKEHAKVFAPSYPARKFDDQSDLLGAVVLPQCRFQNIVAGDRREFAQFPAFFILLAIADSIAADCVGRYECPT